MRVCLMIEGQEGVTWVDWVRLARLTEQHGLEGLFRSDHYTAIIRPDADALDAWATLAGLAAITERIRLGTLVSPATFRHPSVLARMAVTVDHISGGRVDVGMGSGWYSVSTRRTASRSSMGSSGSSSSPSRWRSSCAPGRRSGSTTMAPPTTFETS
jgi:alkanesulfonate monooxygenase SsuD/methylene tetrahydromethanopterin reductase-like flavin-dependent oxidoreductase (luciferase family)